MTSRYPSKPMTMHYCDIFSDCYHCPVPFCPYEKLDDWGRDGQDEIDDEGLDEDENEDEKLSWEE